MPHRLWHQGQPCRENTVSTCKRARDGFSRENLQENMGKPWKTHGFLPLNREVACKILSTKSEHVQPTLTYLRVFGDRSGSSAQSWSKIGFTDLKPNYIYAILWLKNVVNAKCKRNYQLTLFLLGSLCARKRWKKSLRAKYWKNMKKQEAPASAIIPGKNRKGLFLETPWKCTFKKMGSKGACCFRWQTCYVAFWYKYKPWTEERWCHSHFYKANHPFLGFEGHLIETCHSLSFEDLEGSISDLARWKGGNQTIKTQHVFWDFTIQTCKITDALRISLPTRDPFSMDMSDMFCFDGLWQSRTKPDSTFATVKIQFAMLQAPHPKYHEKSELMKLKGKCCLASLVSNTPVRAATRTTMADVSVFLSRLQRPFLEQRCWRPVLALSWWRWSSHSTCARGKSIRSLQLCFENT